MNILDFIVIGILLLLAFLAYRKGFIMACFGFLPTLLAGGATYLLQPVLSKWIRLSPLYTQMQQAIEKSLNLNTLLSDSTLQTQTELIQQMQLPEMIKTALVDNNNPVIYQVLNVTKVEHYITGFLANACINILCGIILFVAVFILSTLLLKTLNLIAELPILSTMNKLGGFLVGLAKGVVVIWLIGAIFTFFAYRPAWQPMLQMLMDSKIALLFYENNLLLYYLLKIFA